MSIVTSARARRCQCTSPSTVLAHTPAQWKPAVPFPDRPTAAAIAPAPSNVLAYYPSPVGGADTTG